MIVRLVGYARDMGSGEVRLELYNNVTQALEAAEKTAEEIENGTFYDDGQLINVELNIINNQLSSPVIINMGD